MEIKFKHYALFFSLGAGAGVWLAMQLWKISATEIFFLKAHLLHALNQNYLHVVANGTPYKVSLIAASKQFLEYQPLFYKVMIAAVLIGVLSTLIFHMLATKNIEKNETSVRGTQVSAPTVVKKALKGEPSRLKIGGIPYPKRLETQGFLFVGSTGSGKSTGISELLSQIRELNQKMILVDPNGEYLQKFGRDGDILLNPFDARTVDWNPFAEIKNEFDVDTIVRQIVPNGEGHGAEWIKYTQTFLESAFLKIWKSGDKFPLNFLTTLFTKMSGSQLHEFFKYTVAAKYFEKGSEGILGSVNTILSRYIKSLSKLDLKGEFSLREWVRNDKKNWIFITYQAQNKASLEDLIGTWVAVAGNEILALQPDLSRRIWLCFDEFPRVGKVQNFSEILTNGRKNGLAAIVGMQTTSQIQKLYGREEAETLLSCLNTSLILKNADPATAETMSKSLGQAEVERVTVNENSKRQKSTSTTRAITPAVLASQILNLPTNTGYLKVAGMVTKISLQVKDYPKRVEPFIPHQRFQAEPQDDDLPAEAPEDHNADDSNEGDANATTPSLTIFGG